LACYAPYSLRVARVASPRFLPKAIFLLERLGLLLFSSLLERREEKRFRLKTKGISGKREE